MQISNFLSLNNFKKYWRMYVVGGITALIATIFLINTVPLITGEIGTLFVPRHIPEDYLKLKDFILSQDDYFRTFWTPRDSRWGIYTNLHPKVSNVSIIGGDWKDFVDETRYPNPNQTRDKIVSVLKLPFADALLDSGAIKYVIVPIEDRANDDNFFVHYGMGRAFYVNEMDQLPYLKKVDIGTSELTVYENEGYAPYIRAMEEVREFRTLGNLDGKYEFVTDMLGGEFDFVVKEAGEGVGGAPTPSHLPGRPLDARRKTRPPRAGGEFMPFQRVHDLAEELSEDNFDEKGLHFDITVPVGATALYTDTGARQIYYAATGTDITVTARAEDNLWLGDTPLAVATTSAPEVLASMKREPDKEYFLRAGSTLIPLPVEGTDGTLGAYPQTVEVLAVEQVNLINNPSLDEGLWREAVGDCNAYDDKGILDMQLIESLNVEMSARQNESGRLDVPTLGRSNVLELSAARHIACTSPDRVDVEPEREYLLSFDYQSPNARNAGYHASFPGTDVSYSERLPLADTVWHTFERIIKVPAGADTFALTVYSYSQDDGVPMLTRYDNFALRPITEDGPHAAFGPPDTAAFAKIYVKHDGQKPLSFSYREDGFESKNLIANPSFEDGLWQEKVGDCNNYDDNPALTMDLKKDGAADGAYALELGARRHIACTGPGTIRVTGGRDYLLAFDYASAQGKQAGYYMGFSGASSTAVSERLQIKGKDWQKFRKVLTVPEGAMTASLVVYSYAGDGKEEIVTRYDDFHFYELPALKHRYYLVTEPEEKLVRPKSVEFELVNPTKKRVWVRGATTPFFLAMSESYHDQWRAMLDNQEVNGIFQSWIPWIPFADRVSDERHFKLNGFLNGWYINPAGLCSKSDTPLISGCTKNSDGSYDLDLVIEFIPQRWFYLGLLISGSTLLACIGYLVYDWRKRKKKKPSSLPTA